jgi:HAD superfamily hydrolase (TIGR01549 family)
LPNILAEVEASLQAIIFDFDGVLVESAAIKSDCFRQLFADRAEVDRIVALHERHGGVDRYTKIAMIYRDILEEPLAPRELDRLAQRFEELVEERVATCDMVPGARELLNRLNGRLPTAVASGTPQGELERIAVRRGLSHYFIELRGAPPDKTRLVGEIMAKGGWEPHRVLMIGDAMTDFDAARSNGLQFIGRQMPSQHAVFPPGTRLVPDLVELARAASELYAAKPVTPGAS